MNANYLKWTQESVYKIFLISRVTVCLRCRALTETSCHLLIVCRGCFGDWLLYDNMFLYEAGTD
jgi:hypothetical protein